MKHPKASRTACRCANPLEAAPPAAWQSQFRSGFRMACSAAFGAFVFPALQAARSAMEN